MASTIVHNFRIEADALAAGAPTSRLSQGSPASHELRVENLSTLDYDIILESQTGASVAPPCLSYAGMPRRDWTMQASLPKRQTVNNSRHLDVHGPQGNNQHLSTHTLRHRLQNPGVPPGSGGWVVRNTHPMPHTITVQVV